MAICDSFTDWLTMQFLVPKMKSGFWAKKIVGNHSANLIKCNFIMILQFMIPILFLAFRIFFKLFIKYFRWVKFIYSEKATTFCEISTLLLSVCKYCKDFSYAEGERFVDKSKVETLQKILAFSEYKNFNFKFFKDQKI